jgi:hypothetical protein
MQEKKFHRIPVDVIQDDYRSGDGLVTLQLCRPSKDQQHRQGRQAQLPTPRSSTSSTKQGIAREYLLCCEKISEKEPIKSSDKADRIKSDKHQSLEPAMSAARPINSVEATISSDPVGDVYKLAYENTPLIYEQTFDYKYCNNPIHGAFGKIQLDPDSNILGATVVAPRAIDFQSLGCSESRVSEEKVLDKVRELAGHETVPKEWRNPPIKWCFDSKKSKWRLAYIVEGVMKQGDGKIDRTHRQHFGISFIEIVDYIMSAEDGTCITEVRLNS